MLDFERFLAAVISPFPILMLMLLIGIILLLANKYINLAKTLLSIGILLLFLISSTGLPSLLVKSSEDQYKPYSAIYSQLRSDINNSGKPLKWIVVFAGGIVNDQNLPLPSRLSSTTLIRLVEGVRLYKKLPGAKLILSGGSPDVAESKEAALMKELAVELGVDKYDIIVDDKSLKTYEQVLAIKKIVDKEDFVLVTSTSHMPRAIAMFDKQGLSPHPIPADYIIKEGESGFLGIPVPKAQGIEETERSFYEIWAKIGASIEGEM